MMFHSATCCFILNNQLHIYSDLGIPPFSHLQSSSTTYQYQPSFAFIFTQPPFGRVPHPSHCCHRPWDWRNWEATSGSIGHTDSESMSRKLVVDADGETDTADGRDSGKEPKDCSRFHSRWTKQQPHSHRWYPSVPEQPSWPSRRGCSPSYLGWTRLPC